MRLLEARIEGFGRLIDQRFTFGEGLTVIAGPNESGKTTLADCIVRLLFGYPEARYNAELDRYRPWKAGAPFAAALVYRLDDGDVLETRRDFGRPDVPTETLERDLMRPVRDLSGTRKTSPGAELLHLSLHAFEAAAVMRAGEFADQTDGEAGKARAPAYQALAARIAALVGSAGDTGAGAALDRLDAFLQELGTERVSTKPLSAARARTEAARRALEDYARDRDRMRANLEQRTDLTQTRAMLVTRVEDAGVRMQAAHLWAVRKRIERALAAQADLARANSARDSIGAPPEMLAWAARLDAAIDAWRTAKSAETDALSTSQDKEDQRRDVVRQLSACAATLKEAEATIKSRRESIERLKPEAGTVPIETETLDRLEKLSELVDTQEASARTKETQAAINRQRPRAGALPAVFVFAISVIALILGAALHIPMLVIGSSGGMLVAVGLFVNLLLVQRGRNSADRALEDETQQARGVAGSASAHLAQECRTLDLSDIRAVRRAARVQGEIERFSEALGGAEQIASQTRARVDTLEALLKNFDRSDQLLVAARAHAQECETNLSQLLDDAHVAPGDLEARVAAFREARQEVERAVSAEQAVGHANAELASALGGQTLEELRAAAATLSASVGDAPADEGDLGALQAELDALTAKQHSVDVDLGRIEGELATFDRRYPTGGAPLEEQLAACQAEELRLTSARDAALLARTEIEKHKDEVHKNFAPHLNALAGPALAQITDGRYTEVSVDPRDFALRVRAPENSATVGMATLSSGTQEQLYLSLRAATAQTLGADEGVPLILDDALAHADESRLAAAVRHLASIAQRQQVLLFTQRDAVLKAAQRMEGVAIVHMAGPSPARR